MKSEDDWGFLHNEVEGGISFTPGTKLIQAHVLLTEDEYKILEKMALEMDVPTYAVIKQGLRLLQMYRAGYLIDNSPKSGGCGACE